MTAHLDDDNLPIDSNPRQDFVLKTIKNRDVHFLRCWFTDVLGNMKSFAVVPGELDKAFVEGMGFDGSSISGFSTTQNSDMLAYPDPSTFQVLPWRPESNAVARMFCNIKTPDGAEFASDPRYILKKALKKLSKAGFSPTIGTEMEYFYFADSNGTVTLDKGSYFDLTSLDYASDLRRDTVLTLEKMGIPVEYSHHENAPSQHEIDLRYTDALSMADAVMTYKLVVKEIAIKHDVFASFMPKPIEGTSGSGMHIHLSLFDNDGNNAFFDKNDKDGHCLSDTAKHFIAGLLKYSREMCLVTNQYVNSYKRLASGMNAPSTIAWSKSNRSTIVRIPGYRPNDEDSCRIEFRSPDPATNPYLAFTVLLLAGLSGIEEKLELPKPAESQDFFALSPQEIKNQGYELLPWTLGEAIEEFNSSKLMKEILGDAVHAYLVETKRREWNDYQKTITPWELEHYLAVL